MLQWISDHKAVLTVFTNFGTLIIWLVYAQLLYNGYKRQRRPRVVINRGKSAGTDALCIISNMSAESIFIQHILARLETDDGDYRIDVTEMEQNYESGDEDRRPGLEESTRQGPLTSGAFVHIGHFDDVIRRLARSHGLHLDPGNETRADRDGHPVRMKALTIRLICIYGSDDMPIGLERRFLIKDTDEGRLLVPATWDSRRLTGWRARRALSKQMLSLAEGSVRRPG